MDHIFAIITLQAYDQTAAINLVFAQLFKILLASDYSSYY